HFGGGDGTRGPSSTKTDRSDRCSIDHIIVTTSSARRVNVEQLQSLRDHLVRLLNGGQAYETFELIVAEFPTELRSVVPPGAERSPWQTLEHLRIAQRDILDFIRNEDGTYVEKTWPDDYWPTNAAPPNVGAWDAAVAGFLADR